MFVTALDSVIKCGVSLKQSTVEILHASCGWKEGILLLQDVRFSRPLGYKNPVRTSQETHYVPATESSRLMRSKICGLHSGGYEACRLLGYKKPVRTSQDTHYFSATASSRLILCDSWGFHGGDYEACRLLGFKNPDRTSQEIHYVSATESSLLMISKIWDFHGGGYEQRHLLGWYVLWLLWEPTFRRNVSSP
jgi:hypothetical protein